MTDPVRIPRRQLVLGLTGALATNLRADDPPCVEFPIVDLEKIPVGEQFDTTWQDRRVYIRHRTPVEIESARQADLAELPDPEPDSERVKDPAWLVVYGECTHAGCKPLGELGDYGGWLCMCHGSHFDASGRIRKGPARRNLEIPPYRFLEGDRLELGRDGPA
jgi:ubiquinol-cytochrome c reductase iron-sulfur subunit